MVICVWVNIVWVIVNLHDDFVRWTDGGGGQDGMESWALPGILGVLQRKDKTGYAALLLFSSTMPTTMKSLIPSILYVPMTMTFPSLLRVDVTTCLSSTYKAYVCEPYEAV